MNSRSADGVRKPVHGHGTYEVISGTGVFAGATGEGTAKLHGAGAMTQLDASGALVSSAGSRDSESILRFNEYCARELADGRSASVGLRRALLEATFEPAGSSGRSRAGRC